MVVVDLNSDVAEGFGAYPNFESEALYEIITSANIACGFHAGDPRTMSRAAQLCVQTGTAAGAHPGIQDLAGFGRRWLQLTPEEALADIVYQVGALSGFMTMNGQKLQHIKPHGALYNYIMADEAMAEAVVSRVRDAFQNPLWFALASSKFAAVCKRLNVPCAQEVFADRAYEDDGSLVDRRKPGAVLHDPEEALDHVKRMVLYGEVKTLSGKMLPIQADSICIHGDNRQALQFAEKLRRTLESEGVHFKAFVNR